MKMAAKTPRTMPHLAFIPVGFGLVLFSQRTTASTVRTYDYWSL